MFAKETTARAIAPALPAVYIRRLQESFATRSAQCREGLPTYPDVRAVIDALHPEEPIFCISSAALQDATRAFRSFPGRALYAVKCNPHPFILRTLFDCGITDFDVASLEEVRLIDGLFGSSAGQFFNNPAKSRPAIRSANSDFGIRFYTADCVEEVDKILAEVSSRRDLVIAARISTVSRDARYTLSTKFGASPREAVEMLKHIHRADVQAGVSFHVGSQCLAPDAFRAAITLAGQVVTSARVPISILNVGGGFPAPYPGDLVRDVTTYFSSIAHGWRELRLGTNCMLICEPGRGLVATAGTVILQVITRRGKTLFVNDGVFGTLQELGHSKERRPTALHRLDSASSATLAEFRIYGPTCDANDVLGAPFVLPEDVREGDWIEVGMMGAYSLSMRTRFNGFHTDKVVVIEK